MKFIAKTTQNRLCKGLTSREMACKCSNDFCRVTLIHPSLIKAYEKFRKLVRVPLIINSGYRCQAHNQEIQGKPQSKHLAGMAVDISRKTIDHLSDSDIEFAAKESGFKYVKFYKTWVHLDVR